MVIIERKEEICVFVELRLRCVRQRHHWKWRQCQLLQSTSWCSWVINLWVKPASSLASCMTNLITLIRYIRLSSQSDWITMLIIFKALIWIMYQISFMHYILVLRRSRFSYGDHGFDWWHFVAYINAANLDCGSGLFRPKIWFLCVLLVC